MTDSVEDVALTLARTNTTLVDCHCHLVPPHFSGDEEISAAVQAAQLLNISAIVNVAEDLEDIPKLVALHERFQSLHPCFGLHPVKVSTTLQVSKLAEPKQVLVESAVIIRAQEIVELLERALKDHARIVVGIGECGLDFTPIWAPSDIAKVAQRFVLESQVRLARELGLPLNVHSRSAGKPTSDLLQKTNAANILMHAFDGRANFALHAVKSLPQCFFSIPSCIVRSNSFVELAKRVPIDRLCLETDSPALHPVKGPNMQNTPSNLLISLREVSKATGLSIAEVAAATTYNATALFPKIHVDT